MNLQFPVVAFLVALSFAYAAWVLLPQMLRVAVAKGLMLVPLPAWWRTRLRAVASASSACGCAGCDKAPSVQAPSVSAQPLVFYPRNPRR